MILETYRDDEKARYEQIYCNSGDEISTSVRRVPIARRVPLLLDSNAFRSNRDYDLMSATTQLSPRTLFENDPHIATTQSHSYTDPSPELLVMDSQFRDASLTNKTIKPPSITALQLPQLNPP